MLGGAQAFARLTPGLDTSMSILNLVQVGEATVALATVICQIDITPFRLSSWLRATA